MSSDAFGPNLRRTRLQRGITLQTISEDTKISVEMLAGLGDSDSGRAHARELLNSAQEDRQKVS